MKKRFLLSACMALSLVLAGCSSGGNSTVKGTEPVDGVSLTQSTFSLDVGETYFMSSFVKISPSNAKDTAYTLESSNEAVFSVDNDRSSITGVSIGAGTLTVTTHDGGYTTSAKVVVGGGVQEDVPDDAGDSDITYTDYTLVFTLYDVNADVQKAPSYGSFYIQGDYDGTWNTDGWWDWGGYTALTETVDQNGNVAYALHLDSVKGGEHYFNIVLGYTGQSVAWNPLRDDNFSFTIATTAVSGGTHYYNLINCYTVEEKYPDPSLDTGDKGESDVYVVFVDTGSTDTSSVTGKTMTGGSSSNSSFYSGTATAATTGTSNKTCLYNPQPVTLTVGLNCWFWFWENNGLDISTGTITIPATTEGTYAVYTVSYDLSSTSKQEDSSAGSWTTGVTSITDYIATL